ncbi:MAG: hypothetical protein V1811_00230, partial [Candidatus Micrarchaeota archaeon]
QAGLYGFRANLRDLLGPQTSGLLGPAAFPRLQATCLTEVFGFIRMPLVLKTLIVLLLVVRFRWLFLISTC